ncbi:MAG: NlpC/P60 family protein [Candidatus Nanopelagicales bacterium]
MAGRHRKPPAHSNKKLLTTAAAIAAAGGLVVSDSGAFRAVTSPADTSTTVPIGLAAVPSQSLADTTSLTPVVIPAEPAEIPQKFVTPTASATSSAPPRTSTAPPTAADPGLVGGLVEQVAGVAGIVAIAKTYIGVPYRWGGKARSGVDCSGLVYLVLKQAGLTNTYRTSLTLRSWTTPISRSAARAGDLVYGPGHVGIYLGGGVMIDAPQPGTTVGIHKVYSTMTEYGRIPT